MTVELSAVCIDAREPDRLARFWAGLLDAHADGHTVTVGPGGNLRLQFVASDEPRTRPNQMHFDLTSASLQDQRARVGLALELGGRHLDIGQGPQAAHVVLADPEGNEFCVLEPGNRFLAGCPLLGCIASDGSYEVGRFWHAALGWPLVWDEGEETAIQPPGGGSKISWGGRPFRAKTARNRLHFDLAVTAGHRDAEVDRLLDLGATLVAATHHLTAATALADPDGNEFCLLDA